MGSTTLREYVNQIEKDLDAVEWWQKVADDLAADPATSQGARFARLKALGARRRAVQTLRMAVDEAGGHDGTARIDAAR